MKLLVATVMSHMMMEEPLLALTITTPTGAHQEEPYAA
jgi:hypothetical protein